MSRVFEIEVPSGKQRERLDVFLTRYIENATRSKVQKAIEQGFVLVDGKQAKASHKVSAGETIHITLPKPPPPRVVPENIPLDIVYEDDYLLVVNKPAGMVTHPAYGNYSGTLVNALLYHCGQRLSGLAGEGSASAATVPPEFVRPGIVHRLDKDTSGLMVVAKDDYTHANLAKQFSDRMIEREYWAIVWGLFKKPRGVIEASLGRSKSDRKKIAVIAGGKAAVTEYEVLEAFEFLSLVKLKLKTGRTHQIRVHLHHTGHPVFGDPTYGGRRIAWNPPAVKGGEIKERVQNLLKQINRQALHAKTIGLIHPRHKRFMKFDSELPGDMKTVLSSL